MVSNQVSDKGVLKPVGDVVSKEGINRYERSGKDETGSYGGSLQNMSESGIKSLGQAGSGISQMAESTSASVAGSASQAKNALS